MPSFMAAAAASGVACGSRQRGAVEGLEPDRVARARRQPLAHAEEHPRAGLLREPRQPASWCRPAGRKTAPRRPAPAAAPGPAARRCSRRRAARGSGRARRPALVGSVCRPGRSREPAISGCQPGLARRPEQRRERPVAWRRSARPRAWPSISQLPRCGVTQDDAACARPGPPRSRRRPPSASRAAARSRRAAAARARAARPAIAPAAPMAGRYCAGREAGALARWPGSAGGTTGAATRPASRAARPAACISGSGTRASRRNRKTHRNAGEDGQDARAAVAHGSNRMQIVAELWNYLQGDVKHPLLKRSPRLPRVGNAPTST